MQFLYYLPGVKNSAAVEMVLLKEKGLGCIFDASNSAFTPRDTRDGPDGLGGMIVSYAPAKLVGYFKDTQIWQKIHGIDAWVGYWKDDPPKPLDIQRESGVDGYYVELGDGNDWLSPVARLADGVSDVPCSHTLKAGKWVRGGPLQKHRKLWAAACEFWDIVEPEIENYFKTGQDSFTIDFDREHILALTALAANYRIQRTEAAILGLFDDQNVGVILRTLIDWPGVQALMLKKKEAALETQENSSTDPGKPDETKPIGQQ